MWQVVGSQKTGRQEARRQETERFWGRGGIWKALRGGAVGSLQPATCNLPPPPVRRPKPPTDAELTILPSGSDNGV